MDKIRKYLALLFACLSVIFAVIAISRSFDEQDDSETSSIESVEKLAWNKNIETVSRRADKLIFFRCIDMHDYNMPRSVSEILKKKYLNVEIFPDAYPADYAILDDILYHATRRRGMLVAGILSPRLNPIYLTREIRFDDTRVSFDKILAGASLQYEKKPDELKTIARNTSKAIDNPQNFHAINSEYLQVLQMMFLNADSSQLFLFFSSPSSLNAPAAILSENARLAIRIAAVDFRQFAARSAAMSAYEILYIRLNGMRTPFSEKLIIARALSEMNMILKDSMINTSVLKFSDEILKKINSENIVEDVSGRAALRDNALSVSLLVRAFSISSDGKYLKSANDIAGAISVMLETHKELPAFAGSALPSQASSLEYVLVAKAFLDLYKVNSDGKYLKLAYETIDEWNKYFMTGSGLWSINSENSPLSNYARPILMEDSILPSYIGEAAQLFSRIPLRPEDKAVAAKLRRMAISAASSSPIERYGLASLKLSLFDDTEMKIISDASIRASSSRVLSAE